MKKLLFISLALLTIGCADNKTIDGVTYRPYGFLNEESCKNDSIHYEISGAAAVSGILFCELFFIPTIYTYGYNLFEPVCHKKYIDSNKKGIVK
jgi:hypothetical protein